MKCWHDWVKTGKPWVDRTCVKCGITDFVATRKREAEARKEKTAQKRRENDALRQELADADYEKNVEMRRRAV